MTGEQPESFPFHLRPEDFGTPTRLYTECPVSRIELPSGDVAHLVLDYDEVEQVLKDRRFSRNFRYEGAPRMVLTEDMSLNPNAIVNLDPPEHTRLRRSIQWAFRPANAASWQPKVQRVTDDLLDAVIAAGPPADLVESFAKLLPIRVMCELVDVPDADRGQLIAWTGVFFSTDAVAAQSRDEASYNFFSYARELVAARRAEPRDGLLRRADQGLRRGPHPEPGRAAPDGAGAVHRRAGEHLGHPGPRRLHTASRWQVLRGAVCRPQPGRAGRGGDPQVRGGQRGRVLAGDDRGRGTRLRGDPAWYGRAGVAAVGEPGQRPVHRPGRVRHRAAPGTRT